MITAMVVIFIVLVCLAVVIHNLGTGRSLLAEIEQAMFIYGLHRRQFYRSRWDAIKETWKEMT